MQQLESSQSHEHSLLKYRHPRPGIVGRFADRFLNSDLLVRLRRCFTSWLPFVRLRSDIRHVVYLNWVVPIDRVRHLVPAGVKLCDFDGSTILSVLTYRHGHFGPAMFGPLRRLLPSPCQSNWRLYVEEVKGRPCPQPTVLFFTNCVSSLLYCVGARLMSDTLPCHFPLEFEHSVDGNRIRTRIEPGCGSAPDLSVAAELVPEHSLPHDFERVFSTAKAALEYLCLQDAAISPALATSRLAHSDIDLPIDVDLVQPLHVKNESLRSDLLSPIIGTATPFCFLVDDVRFRVLSDGLVQPE